MAREESADRDWLTLLPRQVRNLPADLAAVGVFVVLTWMAVLLPWVSDTAVRVVFGLPLVLFLPGYAVVAAVFPGKRGVESDKGIDGGVGSTGRHGIAGLERIALSIGLSIALVPLVSLALNFTPWGIRLLPAMSGLTVLIVGSLVVAVGRRRAISPDERFTVPYKTWITACRQELLNADTRTDTALNIVLVGAVLLATTSVGYAIVVPHEEELFTEFYLLTENDDGDLVDENYPTNFTVGENRPIVVGVGNHEHEQTRYTVVVEIQRVKKRNGSTTVLTDRELDRFETPTLVENETWHRQYQVTPTMAGEELRLAFLLYKGGLPDDPSVDNAYEETHLWVTVSDR